MSQPPPFGRPYPGQPDPGQPNPGQPNPGQPNPGQPNPGQPNPGQPNPGQQGRPYPGQQGYPPQPGYPPQQGYPQQGYPQQAYPQQVYAGYQQPYGAPGQPGGRSGGSKTVWIVIAVVVVLAAAGVLIGVFATGGGGGSSAGCPDLSTFSSEAPHPKFSLHKGGGLPSAVPAPKGHSAKLLCTGTVSVSRPGGRTQSTKVTAAEYPSTTIATYEAQLSAAGWTCNTVQATGCVNQGNTTNVVLLAQDGSLVVVAGHS